MGAGQLLRRRSPAKGKHLGMMGTPVWCPSWALRYLSASHGSGCSGRPSRVGYLGHPGGQTLSEWVAASDDVMCCRSRWASSVVDGYSDRTCVRY
ncbi:hypothetical protein TIFTF001_026159 [Ficus carica]|uniref:Uncharacterized protein n=1 Tax=Ficus carica TaxID=3494 RepID=A0AA88IWI2_FICCA|nr:hypothetical protein TIFTF001_026159 [Ficus carica]